MTKEAAGKFINIKILKKDKLKIDKLTKTTGKKIYWIVHESLNLLEKIDKI